MESSAHEDRTVDEVDRIPVRASDAPLVREPDSDCYADAELERRNEAMERMIQKARRCS